jgi:hypothetical protein
MELLDNLRLEVETDPTGLVNLVANPNGDLGGWGWVTPVAGSAITKSGARLRFTAPNPSAAAWFYTENMAVAAGQYVAASWVMSSNSAGYYRARLEFLNAAGAVISSTAQTGYLSTSGATVPIGPFLAPALTNYVRLRFDVYSTNAGANPGAGAWWEFYQATVAKAATSGALGSSRTNLITNPSFETNVTGWTVDSNTTALVRDTTRHTVGAASGRMSAKSGGTFAEAISDPFPVTAGQDYRAQAYLMATDGSLGNGIPKRMQIWWYDGAGIYDEDHLLGVSEVNTTAPVPLTIGAATAPGGAAMGRLHVRGGASGNFYLDQVIVERVQAGFPTTYFDGSTAAAGGWTYGWTGTAHNSTSTATTSNRAYVEPIPYLNILGGSTTVSLNRKALDVGVIQALVKDASLDPAVGNLIRPGRAVRVTALNSATATWDVLASGTLTKGHVDYDLRKPTAKQATITLATVDANQVLANTNRPDGVGTIAALPYVLEGARVPWNVNGSGNQVTTATVASRNDQASALDQVILARDSALGYAWVTKEGVLTAYTDRTLDYYGTGTPTLDESVYSGLAVTFDTSDCINEVMVKYRRFNATTGEVEEVAMGPYRDAASIDQWGVQQATFTVHGMLESAVAAYAASILAANATPQRRINSVRIPIRTTADLVRTKALIDLYAKVRVVNAAKGLDQTLRVTGIQHDIGPRRWVMTLTFDRISTVAAPIPTTPQGGSDADLEGVWRVIGAAGNPAFLNSFTNFGAPYSTAAYMRKDGIVHLRGLVTHPSNRSQDIFTLPAGYRPAMVTHIATMCQGTSGDTSGINVNDTGAVHGRPTGAGWLSLDGVSFPADQ